MNKYLFTSESVAEGHPDKICDQISDALVDDYLKIDNQARLAIETMATTNKVIIAGETRIHNNNLTNDWIEQRIRDAVKNIGYEQEGFHHEKLDIEILLHDQSADIALGVDANEDKDEGAGDQGIMFGYACNETNVLMPATIYYAHKILKNIMDAVKSGDIKDLGPDAKSQITLEYIDGKPVKADNILVSIQHQKGRKISEIKDIIEKYTKQILPDGWMPNNDKILVNPTGNFVIGGPDGDAGLTGRKIIVDTYGGAAPHGGGAFSGKDPTKVDRSAAYMARYLAKNIVASGLMDKCLIQLSYAIGISQPTSFYINSYNTAQIDENLIIKKIVDLIDLSPRGIRNHLQLNKPIYQRTATYGHFGRDPDAEGGFSWEKINLIKELKTLL